MPRPVNTGYQRLKLQGLQEEWKYRVTGMKEGIHGDEPMQAGSTESDASSGETKKNMTG
ncbi:MAG: GH36 C-terminal domain-containing protein [Coprococcus sp.]